MATRFRRPMLMLGTIIWIMQTVLMPFGIVYAETTIDTEEQEQVELPPMKNYLEEEQISDPRFFFTRSRMQGTVEEPLQVTFFSDQEVSETRVFLPEEATLLKDLLPTGISVEEGVQPNEWIVQSKRAQNTFVLPLVFESEGNYELFVKDSTAMIEITRQEVIAEEFTTDQERSDDISDNNFSDKYIPNNSNNSLDTRNIVNVSTATQFRNAFNNASVTRINLVNDISLNQSLNILTRNLEINGNGFQLFTGNNQFILGNNSVLRLTSLVFRTNLPPSDTAVHISGSNVQIRLNDFDYQNNMIVFSNNVASSSNYSVIFDGGVNTLSKLSSTLAPSSPTIFANMQSIEILNNSVLNLTNGIFNFSAADLTSFNISQGSTLNLNNTFLLGTPIRQLNNLNIEGKANMNITNTDLGSVENIRIGNTGEFLLTSDWSSGIVSSSTNNIEIMIGSIIDIRNLAGATITDGDINVSIDSTNIAFWDLGLQEEEKASIVFSDIHALLSGANASIIGTTTNDRFQKLYDLSGMAAYSRMSNRPVEEMTRTVIAKYLDTEGNEITGSEVITGLLGENYETKGKQFSGYQLTESPSNALGKFSRETIEVFYIYETVKDVAPKDPLDPETEINPENPPELPEDQGQLSIDFISSFNFGSQAISVHDQTYYAQPQRLLNEDGTVNEFEERPNYVQVSDRRSENERNGWTLAVTQKEQFKGEENQVLNGASLSLSNQQVITAQGGKAPSFQSIPCELVPGNRRTLLKAQGSEGTGTWIYRFGDDKTAGTSVSLHVPKGTNPEVTTYQTTLTWELSAVPDN
ncbi:WxL domain-containing protein [Enterococcus casseliflavus]|uniref:WxL domain-containing protein n=1 Tax=Enterococcus casseliflavus TaxID=37734 RepID=UPI003EDED92E